MKINELEVNWLANQKTKNFSFSMSAHEIEEKDSDLQNQSLSSRGIMVRYEDHKRVDKLLWRN